MIKIFFIILIIFLIFLISVGYTLRRLVKMFGGFNKNTKNHQNTPYHEHNKLSNEVLYKDGSTVVLKGESKNDPSQKNE